MATLTHITDILPKNNAIEKGHDTPRRVIVDQWLGAWNRVRKECGTRDGFRFVIFLTKPSIECLECMLGCFGAGLVVIPLNWRWSLKDMCEALGEMKDFIVGIVVDEHFEDLGKSLLSTLCDTDRTRYVRVSFLPKGIQPLVAPALSKAPNNVACVIFTSGTASRPKAAMLTHDNIIFQCQQKMVCCGYCESDVYLHMAPLFHVGGLVSALAMVMANARHVFMPSPQFDPLIALERLQENSCTSFIAVPTMLKDLLDTNERYGQSRALESVKRVLVGAGGLDDSDAARARRMMPQAIILTAYGMTEACSSMSYRVIQEGLAHASSTEHVCVGEIPKGIQLGILNEHGDVHARGKGEIVTRGRHLFHAYFTGQATSRRFPDFLCDAQGNVWFRTGDIGFVSGSTLWLSGRIKDMIKSGGENVAAAEVERVLMKHPDVVECSVYAIPDARWGEAVAAAVVCTSSHPPNQETRSSSSGSRIVTPSIHGTIYQRMKEHCLEYGLSPYKIPKCILQCRSPLPRNATGKVIKHVLQKDTVMMMQSTNCSKL